MVQFKIVVGDKSGKCLQKELSEEDSTRLVGKKIGEKFNGELIDFSGYEFEITGGSDHCGFPMRKDVDGAARKKIWAISGIGIHPMRRKHKKDKVFHEYPGSRKKKTVCGNTIGQKTAQINLKVVKAGSKSLFEEPKAEEAAPAEGGQAEAPKEDTK